MQMTISTPVEAQFDALTGQFGYWEKTKDLIEQLLDITLNYRQSGHPGGSRSKVHGLLATLLSGVMRWDIRYPEKRFGDRFVLAAGHTIPLVYCTLAVLTEAMRIKYAQTGDPCYDIPQLAERAVTWQDLLKFRRRGGLSGHAEMSGKTLFIKFNTGPSGHGSPAAAGEALALKLAGAGSVKVFALEGEGGLTPGAVHETMNSAWALGLDNLHMLVDWNNFGIDEHPVSTSVYGTPEDWFGAHGWRVLGTEQGSEWGSVTATLLEMAFGPNPDRLPSVTWLKTRKGRGYLKYDAGSHGTPHPRNSTVFWETKREFAEKYGVSFTNFGGPAPADAQALADEFAANLKAVVDVLGRDQDLVDYLSDRLVTLGDSVPEETEDLRVGNGKAPFTDPRLFDFHNYPADLFVAPGTSVANRAALAKWGAWVNAFGAREYGRPVFIACSADLTESTNLAGFGKPYGDFPGYGWYLPRANGEGAGGPPGSGVLLPQEITEFANVGLLVGMATVNFARNPEHSFDGFWGACSTYGSFSYLKYGMLRLFSQINQDCQLKVGKVLYVAGHSGPETADDSRTHFGIYEPSVMQLFPAGSVINIHPWEYNEVPVLLGSALAADAPVVVLHLTRPPITVPDRVALGIPSHFAAARGAYVVRDYRPGEAKGGALIVQGTSAMANILQILPDLEKRGLNVKVICAASAELFALQPAEYREQVLSAGDRANSTCITTQGRVAMREWVFNDLAMEYALSADWDNRWRTGGTVEEVLDEAHLSPAWLLAGIERFVAARQARAERLAAALNTGF